MNHPCIKDVQGLNNYKLLLTYENYERRIFDVTPYIKGDWYGKLKDVTYFKSVHIAGDTVRWADGQDLAPHELYENSVSELDYALPLAE